MRRFTLIAAVILAAPVLPAGCGPAGEYPQAVSLLGQRLYPDVEPADRRKQEKLLAEAEARLDEQPGDEEAVIWVGRRMAYLQQYHASIVMYTYGLRLHPDSYRLLRHRGHRYISTRRLDAAIDDLSRAARLIDGVPDEVEPDGLPNALNQPTGTTHTSIYYHLGLAQYLLGDWEASRESYARCLELAANDDMRCAAAYWLYLSLRRLGRDGEAAAMLGPFSVDMDVIENHAYHELLLMYKGEIRPDDVLGSDADAGPVGVRIDDATRGYGVGMWHLLAGDDTQATAVFEGIVSGPAWSAFGYIAAEAELARDAG